MASDLHARSLAAIATDRAAVVRLLAQISRIRSSVHGTFELVAASCEQPQQAPGSWARQL